MKLRSKAPTQRQIKRVAKLKAIQNTALHLVVQGGISHLTIQRLAKELGWSVGALYRYYPSKNALLVEVQKVVLNELNEDLKTLLEHLPTGLPRGPQSLCHVLIVVDHFRRLAIDDAARFALLTALQSEPQHILPDEDAQRVAKAMFAPLETVVGALEEAQDSQALSPGCAKRRTLLLWTSLQGVLQSRKLARLEPLLADSKSHSRALCTTLLLGWGAKPEHVAAAQEHVDQCS